MSELHKFVFEGQPVRGMLVRLDEGWQDLLRRRAERAPFAPELRSMLGEMTAAAVLMQANLKFKGALVLQVFGDGPVKLAVAEVQPELAFRATATVVGEVEAGADLSALLDAHGKGRCAITLDPKDRQPGQQPYQGIVPLRAPDGSRLRSVAAMLEHYMQQSEQLQTRLVLAADAQAAAGLLLQRLPSAQEDAAADEAFQRIAMLGATLSREELLSLDAATLLHRLFWQEPLRRFEPLAPRFVCTCSRERVRGMLRGLGREDSESLIAERGVVEVGCEFCGTQYRFDAVDVGELFTPQRNQPPASRSLQ
ncbi:MAG: Hsp33 family molecular chaperone HslO [Burkholderiales bacterium]|nr:Hsp33 family molecular chaperone HslO [Burkholderiales bacterium]